MKRIRLNTVMLLVVIAALSFSLLEQRQREARRLADLEAMRAEQNADAARAMLSFRRFWPKEDLSVNAEGRPEREGAATSTGGPARNEPNPSAGPGLPD